MKYSKKSIGTENREVAAWDWAQTRIGRNYAMGRGFPSGMVEMFGT